MSVVCNKTPLSSSCMYSWVHHQKEDVDWFYSTASQITAPNAETDGPFNKGSKSLVDNNHREKNYKHVPHRDKPPQVVARRNARERRRVQAVNSAFLRLKKAVPIQNVRGKRISKVKTLQYAIDYIQALQQVLVEEEFGHQTNFEHSRYVNYHYRGEEEGSFSSFEFEDDF